MLIPEFMRMIDIKDGPINNWYQVLFTDWDYIIEVSAFDYKEAAEIGLEQFCNYQKLTECLSQKVEVTNIATGANKKFEVYTEKVIYYRSEAIDTTD